MLMNVQESRFGDKITDVLLPAMTTNVLGKLNVKDAQEKTALPANEICTLINGSFNFVLLPTFGWSVPYALLWGYRTNYE